VYEKEIGPVPEGKVLDHLCRRPQCVAPHHLEPVTKSLNEQRKLWRKRANGAHCAKMRGIVHDAMNAIVTPEGGRVCRQCNAEALERMGGARGVSMG
jgi:hypothetical protein